jgi:hypothetical protein
VNAHELAEAMLAAKRDVDDSLAEYRLAVEFDAQADDECRRAMARAMITCREQMPKATVGIVNAAVDLETSELQKRARLQEGVKRGAAMAVSAKRQWLSSLQSLASLTKSEAELARWTPRELEDA